MIYIKIRKQFLVANFMHALNLENLIILIYVHWKKN